MRHEGAASREIVEAILQSPDFAEHGFGPVEAHDLRNTRCEIDDEDRLRDGLTALCAEWGKPIVVVSHVGLPLVSGRWLSGREAFIQRLKRVGHDLGITVFEPATVINQVGRQFALQRDGEDVDHYAPRFERIYGWYLLNRVIRPALPPPFGRPLQGLASRSGKIAEVSIAHS